VELLADGINCLRRKLNSRQHTASISRVRSTEIYPGGSQIDVSTPLRFKTNGTFIYILAVSCILWNCLLIVPSEVCKSVTEASDRPYSHVVVTTKAIPDLNPTSTLLSSLLSPPYSDKYAQPTYVLLQNGLNVEMDLYDAIKKLDKGEPKIISAAVYISTNLTGDNTVQHYDLVSIGRDTSSHQQTDSMQDRVSLGIYRPHCTTTTNTVTEENILAEFSDMLETGGGTVKIVSEIQRIKFVKNLWNLSFAAVATLVGYRLPAIFREPPKSGEKYEPYVGDTTKRYVEEYTIPNIRAILEEAVTLGASSLNYMYVWY